MEEKKRFVVQRSLPRGKDAFVQGQYGQERVVRLRAGTRRRYLHPCRRACRQHGFSHAGEIHLGGGGWEFRAAPCSPTCERAGFRTRISGGRAENAALRRAERLSLGAGHPLRSGRRHCRQVSYRVHEKPYFAIGFQNVSGGWELRSRLFKGCIPPKDISLVLRQGMPTDACDVFEGFFDFLSATTLGLTGENDALVLNSVGNLAKSFRYLDGYKTINCYLDNDEAGRKTFEALRTRYAERAVDRSGIYAGSKDLNEHLQTKLSEKTTNNKTLKFRL